MEGLKVKIFKCFIILTLVFSTYPTQAKVIALGSSNKEEDFKEYLVKNPGYISLSQHILQQKISESDSIIEEKYKLAVKGLALADLKPSIFLFKEIIDFQNNSFIFSDSKIELISESFYRLANLDRANDDYWVKQGILSNPGYQPSNATFNPIIMEKYSREKEDLSSYFYDLDISGFKPRWSKVFIDSKRISTTISVYPSANYTLQVFKEGHLPYKEKLIGSELINKKSLRLSKYNFGSCQNPKFFEPSLKKSVDAVFYSKDCVAFKKEYINLAKSSETPSTLYNNSLSKPSSLELEKSKRKGFFSNKKNWYYIVGGVVLTSLAIGLSQSNDTKVRPVQHD